MAKRGSALAKKAKKKGLAKSKMANIRNMKRIKNKEFTPLERQARTEARHEKKKSLYAEVRDRKLKELRSKLMFASEAEVYPLSAEVTGQEMMSMIAEDDLDYLVGQHQDESEKKLKKNESVEKSYEIEERSFNPLGNDVKTLLPFKTKTGIVQQRYTHRKEVEDEKAPKKKKKWSKPETETVEEDDEEEKEEEEPEEKSVVVLMAEREQTLERKKVAIGCLAVNFLEMPQQRMHCLSTLLSMLEEKDLSVVYTVRKYAAVTLLEVFQKTLPSYHIDAHDLTLKLKKETKEQYLYENLILKSYQTYLKNLEQFLKKSESERGRHAPVQNLAMVALRCMGELLVKHSYFTYTNNIIAALVPYLNHRDDKRCHMIADYFRTLFKEDIKGDVSMEAMKRIDHFVRKRAFNVRVDILNILLCLRIKNVKNLDEELEAQKNAKKKLTHTEKLMRKFLEERKAKKSNKEAKKFRKFRKLEEVRKEQKMAQDQEIRSVQHTQITEILFGLYFHILKRRPNNALNGIVLEGLAKFSHLVNIEFFSDLLNVLAGLMEEGTLKLRESLHCIQTVFTILSDQGEVLTIDPRRFYSYLYVNLYKLSGGGENQDDVKSALLSMMQMLVIRRKRVSEARVYAFMKRLSTLSLTMLHNGAIASLATARYIMLTHPSSEALLEVDAEGANGVYSPEVEEPEHCNASASALWELHLLNRHYHGTVRQFADHMLIGAPLQGDKQLPANVGKRRVQDLYDEFDPSMMRFNPVITSPSQYLSNKMCSEARIGAKKRIMDQWTTQSMRREVQSAFKGNDSLWDILSEQESNSSQQPESTFKKPASKLENVNFYKGLLPNMDLSKIKTSELSNRKNQALSRVDVDRKNHALSLVDVDHKT